MMNNNTHKYISLDIGSTYTKGGLFYLDTKKNEFILEKQASHHTTVAMPLQGVQFVLDKLKFANDIPLYFSSSAKGGLSIVAIGIVPDLTLHMAQLTAYSAGGKITKVFAYKLTPDDIEQIDTLNPDIILFAGGTDGGNEHYNLHNAKLLATLKTNPTILYAGNKAITKEIQALLANKNFEFAPNILPQIDNPEPEAARTKIRDIFLRRIIECKGLTAIRALAGHDPYPTPFSVYELIKKIPQYKPNWQSFCLIDMGGATTDFYSQHREEPEAGIVYKGIKDPDAIRTVEGDLGMRVSAAATFAAGMQYLQTKLSSDRITAFANYITKITANPEHLPTNHKELEFDSLLAKVCIGLAAHRHAGTRKKIFTADGETYLQHGKDLTSVRKIIGTGGYLAFCQDFTVTPDIFAEFQPKARGTVGLVPHAIEYYIDSNYIIPLLANLAHEFPEASVNSVMSAITKVGEQACKI